MGTQRRASAPRSRRSRHPLHICASRARGSKAEPRVRELLSGDRNGAARGGRGRERARVGRRRRHGPDAARAIRRAHRRSRATAGMGARRSAGPARHRRGCRRRSRVRSPLRPRRISTASARVSASREQPSSTSARAPRGSRSHSHTPIRSCAWVGTDIFGPALELARGDVAAERTSPSGSTSASRTSRNLDEDAAYDVVWLPLPLPPRVRSPSQAMTCGETRAAAPAAGCSRHLRRSARSALAAADRPAHGALGRPRLAARRARGRDRAPRLHRCARGRAHVERAGAPVRGQAACLEAAVALGSRRSLARGPSGRSLRCRSRASTTSTSPSATSSARWSSTSPCSARSAPRGRGPLPELSRHGGGRLP